jgi:hypothetical protein
MSPNDDVDVAQCCSDHSTAVIVIPPRFSARRGPRPRQPSAA